MARKPRICKSGLTYKVKSECHNHGNMMEPDKMKEMLIAILKMTLEKYSFELISYLILDNNFYFIIKTLNDVDTISRIMQYLKSRYAQRYNRKMSRTGAFWNERFSDIIIDYEDQPELFFTQMQCDMAFDPLIDKKVKNPLDYRFSSIRAYLYKDYKSPVNITLHEYFLKTGDTFKERVEKFMEHEVFCRKRLELGFL